MLAEHYIEWIALKTRQGVQIRELKPGKKPTATFALSDLGAFIVLRRWKAAPIKVMIGSGVVGLILFSVF